MQPCYVDCVLLFQMENAGGDGFNKFVPFLLRPPKFQRPCLVYGSSPCVINEVLETLVTKRVTMFKEMEYITLDSVFHFL